MTGDQLYEINKEAIASRERIETAVRTAARDAESEQRRVVALTCALASYGVGMQSMNPPALKPDDKDILARAARFDDFICGKRNDAEIIPIAVVKPGE